MQRRSSVERRGPRNLVRQLAWLETASDTFVARHDERDAPDVERVLAQLEHTRARLDERFPERLGELAVVVHGSAAQLDAAEPWLPLQRRLTAPAGRRYLVGWAAERELHVLAPRLLAQRASNVEGSLELLMLAPVGAALPALRRRQPPRACRRRSGRAASLRWLRWAWLLEGAAQYFSGQTAHVRPAITRRLRESGAAGVPARPARRRAARRHGVRPARARGGRARVRRARLRPAPRRPARAR